MKNIIKKGLEVAAETAAGVALTLVLSGCLPSGGYRYSTYSPPIYQRQHFSPGYIMPYSPPRYFAPPVRPHFSPPIRPHRR